MLHVFLSSVFSVAMFGHSINALRPVAERGMLTSSLALGYPKFKQEGMVAPEHRPATWLRDGAAGPSDE
jgi:hypothetical protein